MTYLCSFKVNFWLALAGFQSSVLAAGCFLAFFLLILDEEMRGVRNRCSEKMTVTIVGDFN